MKKEIRSTSATPTLGMTECDLSYRPRERIDRVESISKKDNDILLCNSIYVTRSTSLTLDAVECLIVCVCGKFRVFTLSPLQRGKANEMSKGDWGVTRYTPLVHFYA